MSSSDDLVPDLEIALGFAILKKARPRPPPGRRSLIETNRERSWNPRSYFKSKGSPRPY